MDRGERQKGRTDKEITHVLSQCSQNKTGSSTSFKSEWIFFFSNLSLLLTGTVISGCYGNSHMPNQPDSGNTHNYTRSHLPHIAITLCLRLAGN